MSMKIVGDRLIIEELLWHLFILHLHFGVFEPNGNVAMIDVESAFEDAAHPLDLLLTLLPNGILDPVGHDAERN